MSSLQVPGFQQHAVGAAGVELVRLGSERPCSRGEVVDQAHKLVHLLEERQVAAARERHQNRPRNARHNRPLQTQPGQLPNDTST